MLIDACELAKAFGPVRAVDGISLRVDAGEIVGLLGVNGAGKSTLIRLLSGVLMADAGTASIAGYDITSDRREARMRLGYLPEAAAGFANLTVAEFLTFAFEARGLRGDSRAAVARVAARLDLTPALGTVMGTLSKGWRQRAWLAQAMIHDPPVLILDEPTDGLDPTQKAHLRDVLRDAARTKAIVLSSHILEEAEALCDRIVMIAAGRVVADAPLGELLSADGRLAPAFGRLTGAREGAGAGAHP
jgi:ABC-2 type transport system ATP-binding protein